MVTPYFIWLSILIGSQGLFPANGLEVTFPAPLQQSEYSPSAANPALKVPQLYQYSPEEFFALPALQTKIDKDHLDRELLEAAVFQATNEERHRNKKLSFEYDTILNQSARFHSNWQEKQNTLDHINHRHKKYRTPLDRIQSFDGNFKAVAENLALISILDLGKDGEYFIEKGEFVDKHGQPITVLSYAQLGRKVVADWMHSKGHRENLMSDYKFLGCGVSEISVSKNGIPEIYFTQNFGSK